MQDIDKSELVKLINKQNPIIFDIGCNNFEDALEFDELFDDPKIYCFDPDPRINNAYNSRLGRPFSFYPIALSNINSKCDFYLSDKRSDKEWTASSSMRQPKEHLNIFPDVSFKKKTITVNTMRLDTWLGINLPNIEVIDLIWADVNGGEGELLQGAGNKTLQKTRFLYIEFCKKELYEGQILRDELMTMLYDFDVIGTYNEGENFGNMLFMNKFLR